MDTGFRDGPMNIELPDASPVTGMIGLPDCLLVLQAAAVYKVRSPATVDPAGKNLALPWSYEHAGIPGSADDTVARLLAQTKELAQAAMLQDGIVTPVTYASVVDIVADVKSCEQGVADLAVRIDGVIERIGVGLTVHNGLVHNVPQLDGMDPICTNFLVTSNRVVRTICRLACQFLGTKRLHSGFGHIATELLSTQKDNTALFQFIRDHADPVQQVIDFRNYQEHPDATVGSATIIENFRILPDGTLSRPTIRIQGVKQTPAYDLLVTFQEIAALLVDCAEGVLLLGVLLHANPRWVFGVTDIPENERSPECPVRFRIEPLRLKS